ncbi:MAG: hypothetical protein WAN76_16335 [Candidatus Sulfotelmatobacter sp.]|jgi:hypothetical protein
MRGKLVLCAILAIFCTQPVIAQSQHGCALPDGLSQLIASKYPNAHVVTLSDLNQDDEKLFQTEHGSDCPGLASVNFYGDGKPTVAVVLLRNETQGQETQLIVAHELQSGWELRSLEQHITGPAPVVWRERPGKYDDVYGEKTIKAINPAIVLCGYESWAILYAWVGNRVEKIWLRD